MTDPQRPKHPPSTDDAKLALDDAQLVSRIEQHYRVPERAPAQRVAFQQALDERLARDRSGLGWSAALAGFAGVAALCLVAWGVLGSLESAPAPDAAGTSIVQQAPTALDSMAPTSDVTPEEALLALSEGATETLDELPDDYQAIASLFLGDA
jgi:hypothetical protein